MVTYLMLMHIMHYWIRMHKLFPQVGITTIQHFGLTYAFDRELLLGHLSILKILLPRMPHLGAQTAAALAAEGRAAWTTKRVSEHRRKPTVHRDKFSFDTLPGKTTNRKLIPMNGRSSSG